MKKTIALALALAALVAVEARAELKAIPKYWDLYLTQATGNHFEKVGSMMGEAQCFAAAKEISTAGIGQRTGYLRGACIPTSFDYE